MVLTAGGDSTRLALCLAGNSHSKRAVTENQYVYMSSKQEGLQTSNLVYRRSTMTRITEVYGDLKGQRSRL